MKAKIWFLGILTWILFTGTVYGQLKGSHQDSLLIEQQTGFYLKHAEQCWEVVEARNQTIDSLRAIGKTQKNAAGVSLQESRIAQRIIFNLKDTLLECREMVSSTRVLVKKEHSGKIRNRKWGFVASVIAIGEAVVIYSKFMLWK